MQRIAKNLLLLPWVLAGCSSPGSNSSPLIPDEVIVIAPGPGGTITAGAAMALGAAYLIYDPLAPNWEIQEKRLDERRFYLSFVMKRFNTGGDGDVQSIIKRRAQDLVVANGMGYYKIEALEQRIDSQTIGARRMAEAVVALYPHAQPPVPVAYPPILAVPLVAKTEAATREESKVKPRVKPKSSVADKPASDARSK